jgi:hypothetical protein
MKRRDPVGIFTTPPGACSLPMNLLPRCYQDRTTQPHLDPCQDHPGLLFLVGLDCLRLDFGNFVNRRSLVRFQSPAPGCVRNLEPNQ